ncbi:MAG: family 43 glycosylhydrolase [Planctomycetota bacterium]
MTSNQAIVAAAPSADLTPLFDQWLRDTFVFFAPDGWYYLTGTLPDPGLGHCWATNPGVPLWRSRDLKTWEDLGLVWSFERDGKWDAEIKPVPEKHWEIRRRDNDIDKPVPPIRRAAWAPEMHFFDDTYWLTFSLNWVPDYGTVLVRSTTGKPEGPYAHVADGPITSDIDSSVFVDDDGTVYFIWLDGRYAPLNEKRDGLAGPPHRLQQTPWDPEPYLEGTYVFKAHGKYHLALAAWSFQHKTTGEILYAVANKDRPNYRQWDYDCVVATSDRFEGPYGPRYVAIRGGGHNNFFQDRDGQWWSSFFGNPRSANPARPLDRRPAIVPMQWTDDGRILPVP